jgi:multisubunit Na+/H+ antiporter MnhG subunit
MSRIVLVLYLLSLALLPWTWFPPFPWLHRHAQWSDAVFAAAAVAWLIERWHIGSWPRLQPAHAGLVLYFVFALLSLLLASPGIGAGIGKLVGVAELCVLAFITSDIASRPGISERITRVIAITSLITAAAAIAGLILFYAGISTGLVGTYGDLRASDWYTRVQAGTYHPNLLASFCIFAASIAARREGALPNWLRRTTLTALAITVLLTFSRGVLGFVLALLISTAHTLRRRRLACLWAAASGCVVVVLTIWNLSINPARPLEARFDSSDSSRHEAAASSLATLVQHPVLGMGLGTQPARYRGRPFDSHCTPLNIAATLGLPALVTFAFLIASSWRRRARPTDLAIWGGLAGLALDGLAQDVEDFRHVWVMIGLAGAASAAASVPATEQKLAASSESKPDRVLQRQ